MPETGTHKVEGARVVAKDEKAALPDAPRGAMTLRAIVMPGDLNANGTLFGGWILSQMDLAASAAANERSCGRTMTVGATDIRMMRPAFLGEAAEFYTEIVRIGRTSIHARVELWASRAADRSRRLCAYGQFALVAIDDQARPRPVPPEEGA